MHNSKKAAKQVSRKSCLLGKKAGTKLVKSLQVKKDKSLHSQKRKPQAETVLALIARKRKLSNPSSKSKGDDSRNLKLSSKKVKHKAIDACSSNQLHFSTENEKVPHASSKSNKEKTSDEDISKNMKRRRKKKRHARNVEVDEATRLQKRTRYLLIKIKLEQNLIDAYSAEGWKGQSKEKIKPEKELHRAKKQIMNCKIGIREAIHQLDMLASVGRLEDSVIAEDGSVHHEHIHCAKCKSREASPDNDIILCDGTCNCAFHQKCHDPPLNTENSDHGWLCKNCDCKVEILEAVNAHLGTHFSINSDWQDIFKEEATHSLDKESSLLQPEADWPSDDSQDDDYNPCRSDSCSSISSAETHIKSSDGTSSSTSMSCSLDEEIESGSRLTSEETTDGEILSARRQRSAVDYRKLHDEMFGRDAAGIEQMSEDEDWGPGKRKRRKKESDAASTLITLHGSKKNILNVETAEGENESKTEPQSKRTLFRLPPNAVEKLRQVFAENELPPKSVRDDLSKELGLDPEKVSKWFKNARYTALKAKKVQGAIQLDGPDPQTLKETGTETLKEKVPDSVPSKDTLTGTAVTNTKNLKSVQLRKTRKLPTISSNKTNHRRVSPAPPASNDEVDAGFSDDTRLINLLKAKCKKKKVDTAKEEVQVAEAAMERLCQLKSRVEIMREKIKNFQSSRNKKSLEQNIYNDNIIYVPVAELRDKT